MSTQPMILNVPEPLYHQPSRRVRAAHRQAFWSTAVGCQSAADVATERGMTANALRMAKSRALHRLREELGDLVH